MLRVLAAVLVMLGALAATPAQAQAQSASQAVERLNATLLDVMRNAQSLGYRGRAERLRPMLLQTYDLRTMGRTAVGLRWEGATPEQQNEIIDLFGRFTVATYASRFNSYGGENFEVTGEQAAGANTLVRSRIVRSNGRPVQINYLVARAGGGMRVIDVYLDSTISEVATRRSEFTSIIARGGIDALTQTLRERIARIEQSVQ
jgi:phospholipid transport system substrate-binding protein